MPKSQSQDQAALDTVGRLESVAECVNPVAIKEFLRRSRHLSDDNIRSKLAQDECSIVANDVFAHWEARDRILNFCDSLIKIKTNGVDTSVPLLTDKNEISQLSSHARDKVKFQVTNSDPRVDSYAARNEILAEANANSENTDVNKLAEQINAWMPGERETESIVRSSTKQELVRRCLGGIDSGDTYGSMYISFVAKIKSQRPRS